jgi:transcriptional regulator with XRE-family HTH domain
METILYHSKELGKTIKTTRKKLGVTQRSLALTSGTGLRFIIELEKGKPTCQLEKALIVLNTFLYSDQLQLAPLYDLICTVYYKELSQKMAMKIGEEYDINKIRMKHFDKLADEIGFSKPQMRKLILKLIDAIFLKLPEIEIQRPIQEDIAHLIRTRCEYLAKQL